MPNPLPVALPAECRKAAKLYSAFVDPVKGADGIIPAHVLRKAKGFAFLTVSKVGFIMSARAGTGIVIARLPDGSFSPPSAIGTAGAGFGLQAGAELTEFIIILNSRKAVQSFMAAGSLTLGGNMSVAAGPIGRNLEGSGTLSSKGAVAAIYSYSRTKGLFGGASVEGSVIVERSDANAKAYGYSVTAAQLLSGHVDVPQFAESLIDTISRRSGGAQQGGRDDYNDYEYGGGEGHGDRDGGWKGDGPGGGGGYAFGTAFASGGTGSSTPTKEKTGFLSAIGRSRSSSTAATRASKGAGQWDDFESRDRERERGGPAYSGAGGAYKFDQDFGDEYSRDRERAKDSGLDRAKAKFTKSRSGSGSGARGFAFDESRDRAGGGSGRDRAFGGWEGDHERDRDSRPRESFDSLDDDDTGRYRSNSTPVPYAPSTSTRPRANSAKRPSYTSSPFGDDPSPTSSFSRPGLGVHKKSYQSKPWDSEDEDLMNLKGGGGSNPRSRSGTITSAAHTPLRTPQGDPFDFSEVDVDFTRSVGGRDGYANMTPGSAAYGEREKSRSRSGTLGGGLGSAIALFDFDSNEAGDLPFKKGDVITILKQDDEEWWTGRIAMREGIIPKNRVEYHAGVTL